MAHVHSIETLHLSGHSNREIARILKVDRGTVNKYVRRLKALAAQNRPNAPPGLAGDETVQNRPNPLTGSGGEIAVEAEFSRPESLTEYLPGEVVVWSGRVSVDDDNQSGNFPNTHSISMSSPYPTVILHSKHPWPLNVVAKLQHSTVHCGGSIFGAD